MCNWRRGFRWGCKDVEALPLYNVRQKETVDDVIVNPQLSAEQWNQVKDLLIEYKEVFSDVPTVTHLIERKVELTESEPVKMKPYPIPYKMQEVIDKEIEDMLAMGINWTFWSAIYVAFGVSEETWWQLQDLQGSE